MRLLEGGTTPNNGSPFEPQPSFSGTAFALGSESRTHPTFQPLTNRIINFAHPHKLAIDLSAVRPTASEPLGLNLLTPRPFVLFQAGTQERFKTMPSLARLVGASSSLSLVLSVCVTRPYGALAFQSVLPHQTTGSCDPPGPLIHSRRPVMQAHKQAES